MIAIRVQHTHPFMTLGRLQTAEAELNPKAHAAAAGAMGLDSVEPGTRDAAAVRLSAGIERGDHACLDEFYRAWFDRAFAAARSFTRRDEAFCLDVVQDAMLRAIKSLRTLNNAAALEAWMHAAIRSACIDALRCEARRMVRELRAGRARNGHDMTGPRDQETESDMSGLMSALAELDPESRELVRLRFERDKTLDATARAMGLTMGAAHGRIRRILGWMKERMEK